MADQQLSRSLVPRLVPLLLLSLMAVSILLVSGPAVDLNDRVTKLRYAYRARVPGALGGDGGLLLLPHLLPQTEPGPTLEDRIPFDQTLSSMALQTRDDLAFTPPFQVRFRLRGDDPTAVRVYFAGQGRQEAYLRLDPRGALPTQLVQAGVEPLGNPGLGFTTPDRPGLRQVGGPYSEYLLQVGPDSIVVSSGGETQTLLTERSEGPVAIRLAPVVSPRLSIVDEIEVVSGTSSRSAHATYRLRPLLYPFDLESRLGQRDTLYLVSSLLLLALVSSLFGRLRDVVLRRYPDVESQYAVGLLSLPAQIVTLSAVRAALGLALLSLYAVAALVVVLEVYRLRRVRPRADVFVIRSRRLSLSSVAAALYLGLVAHVFVYRAANLEDFPLVLGIVAASALPLFAAWRLQADRRAWILPTLAVLVQCLLFVPLRIFQPAVTPITFYALAAGVWIVAIRHSCETPTTSRPAWVATSVSIVLAILMVEVAVRGDHHVNHVTSPACMTADADNSVFRRVLALGKAVHAETHQDASIEIGGASYGIDKPPGQFRIVCLGSSSTYGVGVESIEHAYPAQMGELLRLVLGGDIVTINAGLAGARLSFLEFFLERVLLGLDPDVVVLYFGMNGDPPRVAEEMERFTTWFEHDPTVSPTSTEVWAATQLRWPRPWLVRGFVHAMTSRSFGWLILSVQNIQAAAGAYTPGVVSAPAEELTQERGSAWDIVEACRERDVPILLVPEVTQQEDARGCLSDPRTCRHAYYHVFGSLADRSSEDAVYSGTLLSDFSPEIRQADFVDNVHMDRDGYARLARSIADLLVENELLDLHGSVGGGGQEPE